MNKRTVINKPRTQLLFVLISLATLSFLAEAQEKSRATPNERSTPSTATSGQAGAPQKFSLEGVNVEFSIEPFAPGKEKAAELLEDREALVRFKITDGNTGQPLTNLRPAAWINLKEAGKTTDARQCREKIQSFLQSNY